MSSLNNVAPTAASGGRSKRLPEGFPQLLKDVTREILRNYPREEGGQKPPEDTEQWIYEFAANYLRHQHVQAARGSSGSHPAGEGEGDEDQQQHRQQEIANHLFSMFQDADEAGVGELHCIQLQDTLRTLLSELNLPEWVLNVLLEEADENENQKIQYKGLAAFDVLTLIFPPMSFFGLQNLSPPWCRCSNRRLLRCRR